MAHEEAVGRKCDSETVAAAGSCAERWRISVEETISARRSALVELERKAQNASWLGVEDVHEENRVDLHPSLVGGMQEMKTQCPLIALSSKMCH